MKYIIIYFIIQFGIKFPTAYITGIIKVLYMCFLNLKLQGTKLEKCRSYHTQRSINYKDALRPNITWLGNPIKLDVFRCVPCYIPSNDPYYLL